MNVDITYVYTLSSVHRHEQHVKTLLLPRTSCETSETQVMSIKLTPFSYT